MVQKSQDENLKALKKAARIDNFTFNKEKCLYNCTQIKRLEYLVRNGVIKTDPKRVVALNDLQQPTANKKLRQNSSLLSYYSEWIPDYSAVIRPLVQTDPFPLSKDEFPQIRNKLSKSTLQPIDKDLSFTVETGASDFAIAATLNQNSKPVTLTRGLSLALNKSILL